MAKRYKVTLTEDERAQLRAMVSCGKAAARKWNHARMLLDAEESPEGMGRSDPQIHQALGVSSRSVARVRQRFVEEGLRVRQRFVEEGFEAALNPRPRPRGAYKLTPEMESHMVALAKNELSILDGQCLDRRLDHCSLVLDEVRAWEDQRNQEQATIHWRFTIADARVKLKNIYPSIKI
ncbi:MAG: helix-turn-helix domain-containing protein [Planctomycetes bacterium]|nr:helix-turn-helix domain-containing protein [Planctomycetota bacterium]